MPPPTDEQLIALLPALQDAARADPNTDDFGFVPPRIGILEETASRRHLFIFGRRGVGKSTLLRKIQQDSGRFGAEVLFIDVETLRNRPYPDVLIELLIELLAALDHSLSVALKQNGRLAWGRGAPARVRLLRLRRTLRVLLSEPQQATHTVRKLQRRSGGGSIGVLVPPIHGVYARLRGGMSRSREKRSEAEFTQTKMEGLHAAVVQIRAILDSASEQLRGTPTLVVLDDFYHVAFDDQPEVLAYLHQVVKNLPIYLKICGVRHRINDFVEGHPPTGLQVGHDAGDVSLDITLEQFTAAQRFLEQVLAGVCTATDTGLKPEDLATETGRERLVLGSGGVARDYLDLTSKALRRANEREARADRPHNRITAEDVNEVATELLNRKQDDLKRDAGPAADALRDRQTDIVRFCMERNRTNVFLVEGIHLTETAWGKEIETLTDLRLMHRLGDFSLPSGVWRGRRFVGFTLDLTHWTGTRSQGIRQIEFWTTQGRRDMRRTGLVYNPDLPHGIPAPAEPRKAPAARPAGPSESEPDPDPAPVDWAQAPLFDDGGADEPAQTQGD
jgi:hypothetical protein